MRVTLIRSGQVFAPEPLGQRDVLVVGKCVAAVAEPGSVRIAGVEVEEIDAEGLCLVPGLVDPHVHLLGGGGEGGPATRAPEIRIEDIVSCGVTTVIGCLGTDGVTRHLVSLLAKARGLEAEGISAFMLSGSYEVPVTTLTGSVRSDLVLIDKVLGAGEIAISDHRSAQPTFEEIARLAAECRVGGMLAGKAGILNLHVGDGSRGLELVRRLGEETEIPRWQVLPTHCNRNRQLFAETVAHVRAGGWADLTAGLEAQDDGVSVEEAVRLFRERGVSLERVTVSSDANGSLPVFDASGALVGLQVADQRAFFAAFQRVARLGGDGLAAAATVFSTNAAKLFKLPGKGRIAPASDADLLLLNGDLEVVHLFALGRRVVENGAVVVCGTFSVGREAHA